MTTSPTGELLVERMTDRERETAQRVESVLPTLRANAERADRDAKFQMDNLSAIRDAGLLGLIVPERYGGLGGTLRDLAAATFAMGTACPSTALAYFFHCTSASRGLLALEAIDAGLYSQDEAPTVHAFAEKLLRKMGERRMWLTNFASESAKAKAQTLRFQPRRRGSKGVGA